MLAGQQNYKAEHTRTNATLTNNDDNYNDDNNSNYDHHLQ